MGNWRTVHMQGTCPVEQVEALRERLSQDFGEPDWGCLHSGGLGGLQNWAGETISAVGNLGERNFTPEDVADELRKLIADVAPGLKVKVDCGGDYETLNCEATVLVGEDGSVAVLPPSVEKIPEIDEEAMLERLYRAIRPGT